MAVGPPSSLSVVRTMAWVQCRMLLHSYTRSIWALVSALVFVACFIWPVGAVAIWSVSAFLTWEPRASAELLHVFLFGLWAMWVFVPLYGVAVSQTLGTYNLRVFPVSALSLFVGRCLSGLVDVAVVFLGPLYLAVLAGYCGYSPWAFAVGVLSLLLLTLNCVSGGLLLSALMKLLPRVKGLVGLVVVVAMLVVIVAVWLLLPRAFSTGAISFSQQYLVALAPSRFLYFTPPGFAATVCISLREGAVGRLLLSFVGLATYTLLFFLLGSWASLRADLGVEGGGRRRSEQAASSRRGALTRVGESLFSPSQCAVISKQVALFGRDPQLRLYPIMVLVVVIPLLLLRHFLWETGLPNETGLFVVIWMTSMVLMTCSAPLFNLFGYDREGLASLFLSSAPRTRILAGASLVVCSFIFLDLLIVCLLACFVFGQWDYWVQMLLLVVALLSALAGVGNFCSVLWPYRLPRDRRELRQAGVARVWLSGLINMIAMSIALFLASPAVLVAILLPALLGPAALWGVVPACLIYSSALYYVSLRYAARLLLEREPQILEKCSAREA